MAVLKILDCTLRDGGYCNNWQFGIDNILKITKNLEEANIDLIECGFLNNKETKDINRTIYPNIEDASKILSNKASKYILMINCGEYNISDLPEYNNDLIKGIRYTFHKKNLEIAISECEEIISKGYQLYMQPMVSNEYSDEEFINLINKTNKIKPYAFYIVDSFGTMNDLELERLLSLVKKNLLSDIWLGFHSHNNLQLSFANSLYFIKKTLDRNLIIDSTVYGMGRGAGNLNTELFLEYANKNLNKEYKLTPILDIVDILKDFFEQNPWGFSIPYYISALNRVHPNYAHYLINRNLSNQEINKIISLINKHKRTYFDKKYIEELSNNYLKKS